MIRRLAMIICGLVTIVLFALMVFPPFGYLKIGAHAGGYVMPDMVMGYNSEYLYAMVNMADAQAYYLIINFYRILSYDGFCFSHNAFDKHHSLQENRRKKERVVLFRQHSFFPCVFYYGNIRKRKFRIRF